MLHAHSLRSRMENGHGHLANALPSNEIVILMPDRQHPVGIDLGTTFSVVAYVDDAGKPVTIVNAEGDLTTPSAVLFEDDEIIVGREALNAAALEPERVALCPKREMGKSEFSQPINGEFYPVWSKNSNEHFG